MTDTEFSVLIIVMRSQQKSVSITGGHILVSVVLQILSYYPLAKLCHVGCKYVQT